MGRSDPGPQKYKESNPTDGKFLQKVHHQHKYWTELVYRAQHKEIVTGYHTTPADRFSSRQRPDSYPKDTRHTRENDCSIGHYEYYLRHNLYIKSAVEKQNVLNFQVKKVSIRDYTPKSLTQEINMGMWI